MVVWNVLYFPTIRVPSSAWFTRVLLYWDRVGTITPYEYIEHPDRHEPHTLQLIQANLVTQVIPKEYVWRIPSFTEAFMKYLENLGTVLDERRSSFRDSPGYKIHVEKLDHLVKELKRAGLARGYDRSWLEVETATAKEFMTYLAASLGRIKELTSIPLTDDPTYLRTFIEASSSMDRRLEPLRTEVLEQVLPAPQESIDPEELTRFKDAHCEDLRRFRNSVEQKLIELSALPNQALRQRATELFVEQAQDEIAAILEHMNSWGWVRTTLTKLSAVVSVIPGVSPLVGLAAGVLSAFGDDAVRPYTSPFLYAAEAQRALGQ